METRFYLFIFAGLLVAVIAYFLKSYFYDPEKQGIESTAKVSRPSATVIDFVNKLECEVASCRRLGHKIHIKYKNGMEIPYDQDLFQPLNTYDILVGLPAIFTYGANINPETINLIKSVESARQQISILKSRSVERERRFATDVKDIAKSSRKDSREDKS